MQRVRRKENYNGSVPYFSRPDAKHGRKKGGMNRYTKALKDAILEAADIVGDELFANKKNDLPCGGKVGYMIDIARHETEKFIPALLRVLPYQLSGKDGGPIEVITYQSVEEAQKALRERGLTIDGVYTRVDEPIREITGSHKFVDNVDNE